MALLVLAWLVPTGVLTGLLCFTCIQFVPWSLPQALGRAAAGWVAVLFFAHAPMLEAMRQAGWPAVLQAWLCMGLGLPVFTTGFARLGGQAVRRGPPDGLYLTFDDGPGADTERVLDVLDRHGAQATFFVLGCHVDERPQVVARMQEAGHTVGVHGQTHRPLIWLSRDDLAAELSACCEALQRCQVEPHLMRPPWGLHSLLVRQEAGRLGLRLVLWTCSIRDWRMPGAPEVARRIVHQARPGAVLLLHDASHDGQRSCRDTVHGLALALPDVRIPLMGLGQKSDRGF